IGAQVALAPQRRVVLELVEVRGQRDRGWIDLCQQPEVGASATEQHLRRRAVELFEQEVKGVGAGVPAERYVEDAADQRVAGLVDCAAVGGLWTEHGGLGDLV